MKRIKRGDKRFLRGVMWEVISLRPFKIRVWSWGKERWNKPFLAPATRREFLSFGEKWKD